jgi:hypothetical protein
MHSFALLHNFAFSPTTAINFFFEDIEVEVDAG